MHTPTPRQHNQLGGIALRVVLIFVTFVAVGGAIFWLLQSFQANQERHQRKALENCEFGLQQALEKLSANPGWTQGLGKTACEDGSFQVSVSGLGDGDTASLTVLAQGWSGGVSRAKKYVLRRVVSGGDTVWTQAYFE
jgi:hypothetical protein